MAAPGEEQTRQASPDGPVANEGKPKLPATCGVCEVAVSKYKCSRCYLPYCSIACNKLHQSNHPPAPERKPAPETPADPVIQPTAKTAPEPAAGPIGPPNPFEALDKSEKLAWLFRKYPNLIQQLLDIHSATQPPRESPSKQIPASLMRGVSSQYRWSREKGIRRGKAALRRARLLPGEAGEGVREYCTLISLLLGEDVEGNSARAVLKQQFAQHDTDMIRQLLAEDRMSRK